MIQYLGYVNNFRYIEYRYGALGTIRPKVRVWSVKHSLIIVKNSEV